MGRDELVAALGTFLHGVVRDGRAQPVALDPAGVELAQRLAEVAAPDDAEAWHLVGMLHWVRYHALPEGQDQADLQAAVSAFDRVYPTAPKLVPDHLRTLFDDAAQPRMGGPDRWNDEAIVILDDPKASGDLTALNRVVWLLRQAVAATPTDHPNQAMYLSNLGVALRIRFGRIGALSDLDAAVEAGRQAVAATPAGHAERAGRLSSLGAALATRFERTGEPSDLDAAVEAGRQAVAATPAAVRYLLRLVACEPYHEGAHPDAGTPARCCWKARRCPADVPRLRRPDGRARAGAGALPPPRNSGDGV